jgi:hypothetical protein
LYLKPAIPGPSGPIKRTGPLPFHPDILSLALSSPDILCDWRSEAYHQVPLVRLKEYLKSTTWRDWPTFVRIRKAPPESRGEHPGRLLAGIGVEATKSIADLAG